MHVVAIESLSTPSPNAVECALACLKQVDPEVEQILSAIQDMGVPIEWVQAPLPSDQLATTAIHASKATITVDLAKIRLAGDNLIPVLAHEVFHCRQAFLQYGPDLFVFMVKWDAHRPWGSRRLEREATCYENTLRGKLRRTDPVRWACLAPTRADAQRMAKGLLMAQLAPVGPR